MASLDEIVESGRNSAVSELVQLLSSNPDVLGTFKYIVERLLDRHLMGTFLDFVKEAVSNRANTISLVDHVLDVVLELLASPNSDGESVLLMTIVYPLCLKDPQVTLKALVVTDTMVRQTMDEHRTELTNQVLKLIYNQTLGWIAAGNHDQVIRCLGQIRRAFSCEHPRASGMMAGINLLVSLMRKHSSLIPTCLPMILNVYENPPKTLSSHQLRTVFHTLRQQLYNLLRSERDGEFGAFIRCIVQEIREKTGRKEIQKELMDQPKAKTRTLSPLSFDVSNLPIEWTVEIIIGSLLATSFKDINEAIMGTAEKMEISQPKVKESRSSEEEAEDERIEERKEVMEVEILDQAMSEQVLDKIYGKILENASRVDECLWIQLVTRLVVVVEGEKQMDESCLTKTLMGHLEEQSVSMDTKIECGLLWLFGEFLVGGIRSEERQRLIFSRLIKIFCERAMHSPDRKDAFGRFLRLAPMLDNDSIQGVLRQILMDPEEYSVTTYEMLLYSVCDSLVYRPQGRGIHLPVFLLCLISEKPVLRETAIYLMKTRLLGCHDLWIVIRDFCLDQLHHIAILDAEDQSNEDTHHPFAQYLDGYQSLIPLDITLLDNLFVMYQAISSRNQEYLTKWIETVVATLCNEEESRFCEYLETVCRNNNPEHALLAIKMATWNGLASHQFVEFVKHLVSQYRLDGRFVLEIVQGMEKQDIVHYLPHMCSLYNIEKDPEIVTEIFAKCLSPRTRGSLSSRELLVQLHYLEYANEEFEPLSIRTIVEILDLFWEHAKNMLKSQDVATSLQVLVEKSPILPTTLMRTVIQSIRFYPSLKPFLVSSLLNKLIVKRIWTYKHLWEGFIKCCQILQPNSLPLLLQLPIQQVGLVLQTHPDLKRSLKGFLDSQPPSLRHRFSSFVPLLNN